MDKAIDYKTGLDFPPNNFQIEFLILVHCDKKDNHYCRYTLNDENVEWGKNHCKTCDMKFETRDSLLQHNRSYHGGFQLPDLVITEFKSHMTC